MNIKSIIFIIDDLVYQNKKNLAKKMVINYKCKLIFKMTNLYNDCNTMGLRVSPRTFFNSNRCIF